MTRYLFKNVLIATLFVTASLTLVVWLTQSLKLLELVANSDAPPGLFLRLVVLTLPKFLEVILPLSLVMAVLFVYNKFIMDNELIVMRASGMDQYALARPALMMALMVTLMLLFFSTWLTPRCAAEVQTLRQAVKTQYSAFLLREGVFNTFGNKLTVYLRARQPNGDMTGLMIHDTRSKGKPPVTITAKKGRVVMDGNIPNIVVFDGMRQQMDADGKSLSKLYFSRYTIEVKGLEGNVQARWRGAGERTLAELLNPDMGDKRESESRDLFLAEAHHRIVTPWNAVSFTVVALMSILLGPFNRRGQHKKVFLGIVLVILVQALNLFFVSLSKKHLGAAVLVYINTIFPVLAGAYLLRMNGEQKLMALMGRWNAYMNRGGVAA